MILDGVNWISHYKPKILNVEQNVFNLTDIYAGTVDLVCLIDKGLLDKKKPEPTGEYEKWIIDWKSGGAIYDSHKMQVSAYSKCLEKIDRIGIVRVGSRHKVGYEFWWNDEGEIDYYYDMFLNAKKFWHHFNPDAIPKVIEVPETLKLHPEVQDVSEQIQS